MDLEGRTVLVTGANGFVGARTSRRLARLGARVRALVRRPGESDELRTDGIDEIGGDFADPEDALRALRGADLLVHCAATGTSDLDEARRVNVAGTRNIMEAAREVGVGRIAHVSTVGVYAMGGRDLVDESCPLTTRGRAYGVSKAESDRLVLDAAADGLPATVLRPGAILGVHPTSTWAAKVPERIRDGEQQLLGDGQNVLMFLHVEDFVDAILLGLEHDAALGRAYNVVDHHETWKVFTDRVRGWFDAPPLPVVPESEIPEGAYFAGRVSSERIRAELGWTARRTYDDGMDEAAAWWRERTSGAAVPERRRSR